jgi:hypothetical protein
MSCLNMPDVHHQGPLYRYALILLIGVVAAVLLTLSWPRLRAGVRYLPVDTAISKYRADLNINVKQLDGLIERARDSIALHDNYRYWEGLSELQMLSSQDMTRPLWRRRQALEQSVSAAEEMVKRAPANPRTWLRIARASAFLAYPEQQITAALKMSILTGRVEPTLMLARLELGLRFLPGLDEETALLLRDQVVLTWALHQRQMLQGIENGSLDFDLLRVVLSGGNQDIISAMEAHLVH